VRQSIGRIELAYTRAVLPETRWDSFPPGPFSRETEHEHKHKLPEILRRNADGADDGMIEVPWTANELVPVTVPKVPAWAQSIVDAQELLAVCQRRAYVTLNSTNLEDMYLKADSVRAVILQNYLETLLEQGQADFLSKGRIVHRLVVFPTLDAQLHLSDKSFQSYREFLSGFAGPARILRRVDYPGSFKGLVPVYDFAIIKDGQGERVFVAHGVSETSVVDIASPQRTGRIYRVEGYLSWRTADVEFYSALFDWLSEQATEMETLEHQAAESQGAA
jgi:hypothetical protein